jgi:predicted DNA-binding transcriptional regulator AlpA
MMPKTTTKKTVGKKAQHLWLQKQNLSRRLPLMLPNESTLQLQRTGPSRLLDKAEILSITRVSFPTVWAWMRENRFPRSRIVGGKSMWLSSEVDAWLAALPFRPLKGDAKMERGRVSAI